MTDSEVKKEDFLEFINMILSTGEVPGLIAKGFYFFLFSSSLIALYIKIKTI